MVEVKHSLNVRRQKLRDQMEANEELIRIAKGKLKEMIKETPALEEEIEAVLTQHEIYFTKSEAWIESEKLYEVLYTFEWEV